MPKYYISSGTLQMIYNTNKNPVEACCDMLEEINENDTLEEYFYVDERGFRGLRTAQSDTVVIETESIMDISGWT
jgi:hypothetical protein